MYAKKNINIYEFPRAIPHIHLKLYISIVIIKCRCYHGRCWGELLSMAFLKRIKFNLKKKD